MSSEVIRDTNLSHAWGRAFLTLMSARNGKTTEPLLVSIDVPSAQEPCEDAAIRQAHQDSLKQHRKFGIDVTAEMIFPDKLYRRACKWHGKSLNCAELRDLYINETLPRLIARDKTHNRGGTYFARMIDHPANGNSTESTTINQLARIIDYWHRDQSHNKRTRRSALQVACYNPALDLTGQARQGLPCLQQLSFSYEDESKNLILNAYYPAEFIFDRAYGNYLGLCHLGMYMAQELKISFSRLNCFIGYPQLGGPNKSDLRGLAAIVEQRLAESGTP